MHNIEKKRFWLRNAVYASLLFLLFREWLVPVAALSEVTQVYRIGPFLWGIFLFLLLHYVRCRLPVSLVIKALISLGLIAHYFHFDSIFDLVWWKQLYATFASDLQFLLDQQLHRISGEMRTFLFLYGWSMLVYAIYTIVTERHSVIWFISATMLYLLFLQYVWGLDTTGGIWKTFAIGAALMLVSRNAKLAEQSDGVIVRLSGSDLSAKSASSVHSSARHARHRSFGGWKANIIGAVVLACAFAFSYWITPAGSVPTPLIETFAHPLNQMGSTGYSSDDSRLGRSLQQDHSIAFVGYTERLTYWKGETKSYYDGSGWHERNTNRINAADLLEMSAEHFSDDEWTAVYQEVYIAQPKLGKSLFRGGSRMIVHELKGSEQEHISLSKVVYDEPADRYILSSGYRLVSYALTTYLPNVNAAEAGGLDAGHQPFEEIDTAVQQEDPWTDQDDAVDSNVKYDHADRHLFDAGSPYLQLPSTLPDRVRDLAEEIAGDLEDPYEKARAVETYLQRQYTYSLDETEIPPVQTDFVDHFLFEQQQGYCDHFSTTMVVMLRSLGVPARWVKGFNSGEVAAGSEDDIYQVVVRNSNAHSWVEAYIPGHGWISFEPTPGFSDGQSVHWQDDAALPTLAETDLVGPAGEVQNGHTWFGQWENWRSSPRTWFALFVIIAFLFLLAFIWDVIRRIRLLLAVVKLRFCKTAVEARPALALLWKRWFELHGKKASDQTLREYVTHLKPKNDEQREAMEAFLTASEQLQYYSDFPAKPLRKRIGTYWRKGCE